MALKNSKTSPIQSPKILFSFFELLLLMWFLFLIPSSNATTFNYSDFQSDTTKIEVQGDTSLQAGFIELTINRSEKFVSYSVGRAVYAEPVRLWDSTTQALASFDTRFTFEIKMLDPPVGTDGLAFFLAPNNSSIPLNWIGDVLGLFSPNSKFNSSQNPIVAVEFDTFWNVWDPQCDHVGIDVNSIISVATWNTTNTTNLKNGSIGHAWVSYNSRSHNLSVYLSYAQNPVFSSPIVSHIVNLRDVLPECVDVGFSAATGTSVELHKVHSWSFNSTELASCSGNPSGSGDVGTGGDGGGGGGKNNIGLVIGSVVGGSVLVGGLGLILFVWWKKRSKAKKEDDTMSDMSTDDDFEKGMGPKRFTYSELAAATNNFSEERKLGEGGFGGVYRGLLKDSKLDVAVKRISQGSRQGKKEFVSEVKIISRLRHRNLVQLIGWCHQRAELLLVYELMPNGSLDAHLFQGKITLTWALRYKIALGLASVLLYLHEEWEQCVVHRDIKSSNLMLDSSFNAKLGDFGLARFADHELGMKTTMLAGTMGYLAPECALTGKAGKESDVYSFGVVALEIACGRRAVEPKEEENKVGLVTWVWELYGSGRLLEAVDARLSMDFDEQQIVQLMIVGLWCANMDLNLRPSIRQAINVLKFEVPLPDLPYKMTSPIYFSSSMNVCGFSQASSSTGTDSQTYQSQYWHSSCTTNSSQISISPHLSDSSAPLHSAPR